MNQTFIGLLGFRVIVRRGQVMPISMIFNSKKTEDTFSYFLL